MASESTARQNDPEPVDRKASGTRPRASQPEPRVASHEIPPPPPMPSDLGVVSDTHVDFEAHDTIPAPPWLGDDGQ